MYFWILVIVYLMEARKERGISAVVSLVIGLPFAFLGVALLARTFSVTHFLKPHPPNYGDMLAWAVIIILWATFAAWIIRTVIRLFYRTEPR